MQTLTIISLSIALAISWYNLYKMFKLNDEITTEWDETWDKLNEVRRSKMESVNTWKIRSGKAERLAHDLSHENKELKEKVNELCRREDKVIEEWASLKCDKHINLLLGQIREGNRIQYVVYEIRNVKIECIYGTASYMWDLLNSEREIYTKYPKAKEELKKRVEKATEGPKEDE